MRDGIETLGEGRFLRLVKRGSWEYVERVNVHGVAVLVPVTGNAELVLVEQYRPPVRRRMVELPAGLVGDEEALRDESLWEAANRELEEETGYRAGRLGLLACMPSAGGLTNELVSFVHATELERVGSGGGVAGEGIDVWVVPLAGLRTWLAKRELEGCLLDPKIGTGLYLLQSAGHL